MEYSIWLNWTPKGLDYPTTHDITNPNIVGLIVDDISEFIIEGVGKLRVEKVSRFPSDMFPNTIYVEIKCKVLEEVAV
jgi:hypothetical protein